MNLRHKVIFDTDPGVDDAIALYFALAHPAIDLVGITTTFGNVDVEQAVINALYLTAIAGRDIPVTRGLSRPLCKEPVAPPAFIHGDDGLGNLASRIAIDRQVDPRTSAQFIVDTARVQPGEITLVAVGPLGNLADALKLEPALPRLLKQVIVMGGTVLEPGNVSPVAEANIWNDPHAAEQVFGAPWSLSMVGLDVTHRVVTELAFFERLARRHRHVATDTLVHAVSFYAGFHSGLYQHIATAPGCFAHDLLAFVYLVCPDLFQTESGPVRVVCEGLAQGQTILDRRDFLNYPDPGWAQERSPAQVCMAVDTAACLALVDVTLMADWLKS